MLAAIPHPEEIGLRLQPVSLPGFPHLRHDVEGNHENQGLVSEDIQDGTSPRVCPAAGPEKCEGGIGFASHQEPDKQHPKAPVAHSPLFQIHFVATSGVETDK